MTRWEKVVAGQLALFCRGGTTALVGVALAACGGSEPTASAPPPAAVSSGSDFDASQHSGMKVEGILGTIPQRKIEATLQAQLPAFQRCFAEGSSEVSMIAGHMKFYFRVGLDGRVEWVQPRGSSVGHRPTELCLLSLAKQVRFPEPKGGGPAEFSWGFEFEAAEKPATAWDKAHVEGVVEQHREELSSCGVSEPGHYVVTAYVEPGGHVLSAGAATDVPPTAEDLDCVVTAVRTWQFPDPGGAAAKVSFPL